MSALEDLKAAVAANDLGIRHVQDLMTEVAAKLKDNSQSISDEELEEIAEHLQAGAATLSGLTIVPPQTSGVPGAQTANQAPQSADPPTPATPAPESAS